MILISQLLVPPIVGLPDNGDYINVTEVMQLVPAEERGRDRYFEHVVVRWRFDPNERPRVRLLTSELILTAPVILLSRWVGDGGFDLRWAGTVHGAVLLWALWLAAPLIARRWRLAPAVVLALCDAVYFSLFNSLYMDAAAFVFLMLTVAFYLRIGEGKRYAAGFCVALFLFATAKLQHAYLIVLLAPFLFLDPRTKRAVALRWRVVLTAALALAFGAMTWHVPNDYHAYAAYNVIFSELLPKSPHPKEVLAELDLPEDLAALSGTTAFEPRSGMGNPYYRKSLMEKPLHKTLLLFYVRHPDVAWSMVEEALTESALERQKGYGNYQKWPGIPERETARAFAIVSGARIWLFEGRPLIYGLFQCGICLAALVLSQRVRPESTPAVLLLILGAGIELFTSALADCQETTRHLFLFRAVMDLLFLAAIGLAMDLFSRPMRKIALVSRIQ